MPTLTHWIALLGLACSCQAATSASLVARYGLPVMQQFDVASGIRITVEYGPDRMPIAVRLAPRDYNPPNPAPSTATAPDTVAEVAAFFVPTPRRSGMSMLMFCSENCTSVETDAEFTITTRLLQRKVDSGTSAVTITSERGLALTSGAIKARFGSPVAEQFVADTGIGLTARYDAAEKAEEVDIAAFESTRDLSDLEVDRILDELVPPYERIGKANSLMMFMGLAGQRFDQFDNLEILRTTVGENLLRSARVRWVPRPSSR